MLHHEIIHKENYEIFDVLNSQYGKELIEKKRKESPFVGLVQLYKNGELLKDTNSQEGWLTNMTIVTGREFAAQSLFMKKNIASKFFPTINPPFVPENNLFNYKISHFGVGSGGSTYDPNNTLVLTGPLLCDDKLYNPHLTLNQLAQHVYWPDGNFTDTSSTSHPNNPNFVGRHIAKKIDYCQSGLAEYQGKIEVIAPMSNTTSCPGYYTVVKCTCILEPGEPRNENPAVTPALKVDEAMLYCTYYKDDTTTSGLHTMNGGSIDYSSPIPFAHICFYPKYLAIDDTLTIQWYIIF